LSSICCSKSSLIRYQQKLSIYIEKLDRSSQLVVARDSFSKHEIIGCDRVRVLRFERQTARNGKCQDSGHPAISGSLSVHIYGELPKGPGRKGSPGDRDQRLQEQGNAKHALYRDSQSA